MRTLVRIVAVALIVLSILWVDSQLARLHSNWYRWKQERTAPATLYDSQGYRQGRVQKGTHGNADTKTTPPPNRRRRPAISDLIPNQFRVGKSTPGDNLAQHETTGSSRSSSSSSSASTSTSTSSQVQNDRVIVVGKLKNEDTDWIRNELPDWQHAIYIVDDPSAPLGVTQNKGRESNVYLTYIINHYSEALPSTIVFLHSHRSGYPEAWHNEFNDHSNVRSIKNLQTDYVQRTGYANLRCTPSPGCPDEIQPFREPREESRKAENAFGAVWKLFFNTTVIPEVVAAPCCAQFAVSREQVLKRPLSSYQLYHQWVMETDLDDEVSGRVMEYMWHVIFGREAVYCPDMDECFLDVYGTSAFMNTA